MESVLSVHECSFSYREGDFELRDINLAVEGGRMLGMVGPNGSGKSTLLRLMAGILKPSKGCTKVAGRPVQSFHRLELAREMAFLPQSPSPAFELTVREVVALGRYPYQGPFGLLNETDKRVTAQALSETDSEGLADRYFSTLSGGEKQRVLVASILAQQPRIMLLDEPTASLDIHHKSVIFDLLQSLSRKGIAVVVVTHDLNAASQFCDTLALLGAGGLVEVGPPGRVVREDLLSETYQTALRVVEHPATATPMVLVLGKKTNEKAQTGVDAV